jgi:hypothetical protein
MTEIIDFDKITDEEKEVLHISSVSKRHLYFRNNASSEILELYKFFDGGLDIELNERYSTYTLTKEQMIFTAKWMAYSR